MLYLVRHGQTAANRGGLLQGHVDNDLTELGRIQAAAAAEELRTSDAVRVVTSPLRRAAQTAEIIALTLGLDVATEPRLIEIDYGQWDERPLSSITVEMWTQWRADPDFAAPDGESLRSVSARTTQFVADELALDVTSIAVSHVSPIKAAVSWALGGDEAITWRMHLDVGSISAVGARGARPYLSAFNRVPIVRSH